MRRRELLVDKDPTHARLAFDHHRDAAIAADDLKDLTGIAADDRHLQTGKNKNQNVISQRPNAYHRLIKRLQKKNFMKIN